MGKYPSSVPIKGMVAACPSFLRSEGTKRKIICDVGSSFGWLEKELENDGACEIIGIEPDASAVAYARLFAKKARFYKGNALAIGVLSNYADVVCMFGVIEHVAKGTDEGALKEAERVLKEGGAFLLSTPNDHPIFNFLHPAWYFGHRHYKREEISDKLEDAGFRVESLEIKGGLWSHLYLIWLYLTSRITGEVVPRNRWLEEKDDLEFKNPGFHTIFITARKK